MMSALPAWAVSGWNLQPLPVLGLLLLASAYATGVSRLWRSAGTGRGITAWQVAAFGIGVGVLAVALLSPIETASSLLFSAHMLQHMLLAFLAAPLLAFSSVSLAAVWALPRTGRKQFGRWWNDAARLRLSVAALTHPVTVWLMFTVVFWLWHVPALYQAALRFELVHYLEHVLMFGSAYLFWWIVLQPVGRRRLGLGATVLFVMATLLQGTILASLIVFASYPLYDSYALSAEALGISALRDQQLAGMIMRTPASIILVVTTVAVFFVWLGQMERRDVEFG
mgnify:CR=1 FL=1